MNYQGSDRKSKAGFFFSLPGWALISFWFFLAATGLESPPTDENPETFWYALSILSAILGMPAFLFQIIACFLSVEGLKKQRTTFAWVAVVLSVGPFASFAIEYALFYLIKVMF